MGAVSTYPSKFYFYGDRSMNKRNLSQMISIFQKIGCFFYPKNKSTLPLLMEGTSMPLAQKHENRGSAQIKSAILLSALSTPGITSVVEKKTSRNHTEIFLKKINADIKVKKIGKENLITLSGQKIFMVLIIL